MNIRSLIGAVIAALAIASASSTGAQQPESADSLETLHQQMQLINQLSDRFEADAAAQFGVQFNAAEWRRDFGSSLVYQPMESLNAALAAPNLATAQARLFSSGKPSAKHTSSSNNVINGIPPCRIVDTRIGGGGMLGPAYRLWQATAAAATIAAQGGNAAGCGSFPDANGFLLVVTVVPSGAPLSGGANFLTLQHDNFPSPPTSTSVIYYPGLAITNFILTTCQGCGGMLPGGFNAYASNNTHVVIDLVAWIGTPAPIALDCIRTAASGTFSVGAGLFGAGYSALCAAGYSLTGGGCQTSNPMTINSLVVNASTIGYGPNAGRWFCGASNQAGFAQNVNIDTVCCRVPGQ